MTDSPSPGEPRASLRGTSPRVLLVGAGVAILLGVVLFVRFWPEPRASGRAPAPPPPPPSVTQQAREESPPPAEPHAAHRRTVERMQAAVLAANTPPPTLPTAAPEEELPVPDPERLKRIMEEARRNGELADPREASEETYPLTQISPEHRVRLYQQLQRTSNEVAYNQKNAQALRERLAALRAQGVPAAALERLELQLSRVEHARAGSKAWLDEMAPKLARAGMPPVPAPEPGWEPPPAVDYHHGHGHAHDHGEDAEEHSQP